MTDNPFTEAENEFFAEGEALVEAEAEAADDFSDLEDPADDRTTSWVKRALDVLAQVRPRR